MFYTSVMEVYDGVAGVYSTVFSDIRLRIFEWTWLKKHIQIIRPETVLDLGCGNGYLSRALSPFSRRIVAADPSEKMLSIAIEHNREISNIEFHRAGAEQLPCPDNSMDCVISFLSFRYMDWDRALSEVYRVLKPGASFIIIDMFSSKDLPVKPLLFFRTVVLSRLQQLFRPKYASALKALHRDVSWHTLVKNHELRHIADARRALDRHFASKQETLLSMGRRARTIAFLCAKNDGATHE